MGCFRVADPTTSKAERTAHLGGGGRRKAAVSQSLNISHWRLAKEAAVLPAELAYTFVSDLVCGARRVNSFVSIRCRAACSLSCF